MRTLVGWLALPRSITAGYPSACSPDGARVECPTVQQITEKLSWFHDPCRSECDLAIYGAGPAGLSAAIYGATEGRTTILVERVAVGGQGASSSKIENYLGFPKGINGAELAERAREQALRFGAELLLGRAGVRGECVPGKVSDTWPMEPKSWPAAPSAPPASNIAG